MAGEEDPQESKPVSSRGDGDTEAAKRDLIYSYVYYNHAHDEWLKELYDQVYDGVLLDGEQAARVSRMIFDDFEGRFAAQSAPDPQRPTDQPA